MFEVIVFRVFRYLALTLLRRYRQGFLTTGLVVLPLAEKTEGPSEGHDLIPRPIESIQLARFLLLLQISSAGSLSGTPKAQTSRKESCLFHSSKDVSISNTTTTGNDIVFLPDMERNPARAPADAEDQQNARDARSGLGEG